MIRIKQTIYLVLISFLVVSCKKSENSRFLGVGEIALANPVFQTENTLISDKAILKIGRSEANTRIYYTLDGTEPSESSYVYESPIEVAEAAVVRARAFSEHWLPSDITEIQFFKAGIQASSIELETALNERYGGNGPVTLIDLKKGSKNFATDAWIGVQETLIAKVSFDASVALNRVDVCYLSAPGSWIFNPSEVRIFTSDDGLEYEEVSSSTLEIPSKDTGSKMAAVSTEVNRKAKHLKIEIDNIQNIPEWHDGKGTPAWLFIDEIIFN